MSILPFRPLLIFFFTLSPLRSGADTPPAPEKDFPGVARLLLPPAIPALTELETNVYLENTFLALNPDSVLADVTCAKGSQQTERWSWTPKSDETGDISIRIELRDGENRVLGRATSVVRVKSRAVTKVPDKPVTLLIVGDSLTAASTYSRHIAELAAADKLPLRLIGTRGPEGEPENRHEGYGGWTAERFATHYTGIARGGNYRECGSPFLYKDTGDAKPRLDFTRYCQEFNGGTGPDYITILLGCNDTFSATDETINERIDVMFRHYETLVAELHRVRPETRVGAILPMPPAASQDAFGANYGAGQTRWQYRRNQHRLVERMLAEFGGRESENLFLVPAWLALDPVHGFPAVKAKAHSRSAKEKERQSNGVHPAAEGYRQMGDAIYAWLRSFDTPAP